ncbi:MULTISPECIES: LLM class flavin-dependent oxidoreductase [Paraburkholderia]|uniref:LLM class flavin-dependent oxidoreductase n=1 Tax=Paraburkholderia TaxID=1822464 RepID=UPI00224E9B2C|nr:MULTISPECIES: LLM class flavin-dependent oxidoreductase [Paraburkholderia]MCX4162791.1 LLM class flavin-dependent oxidoreductase [Paraburkholderia megapolitana]MDN7158286.1 LLM class flavin-dependent oxidoreductase [Paraburkholderia sp. CHISQ3]MDQ6495333.1 LLM class flavin-dependent oxidoreductase [Paraburkholderia megapolitana]
MKFHWFVEFTYPHLPEEALAGGGGMWVTPARKHCNAATVAELYEHTLAGYRAAAQLGFDGLVVNEHHQYAGSVSPSPNLFAAVLARETRDAAIIVLGNSLVLYNPPTRVAEELAVIDVLSGGRLVAGFVLGTPMDACFAGGVAPGELRSRWNEAHRLVREAWAADEPFAFDGTYTQLAHVNVWPRTVQQPHPPIWLPGTGSKDTWALAAEEGYCYCYLSFGGTQKTVAFLDEYWSTVYAKRWDDNPYRFALAQVICVSETDEVAEREYAEAIEHFFGTVTAGAPMFAHLPVTDAPGDNSPTQPARTTPAAAPLRYADYVERGQVIAGSPATVTAALRKLAQQCRIGHLICILQVGTLSAEQTAKNARLFAAEVMPRLRSLHAEHTDRWMPRRTAHGGLI